MPNSRLFNFKCRVTLTHPNTPAPQLPSSLSFLALYHKKVKNGRRQRKLRPINSFCVGLLMKMWAIPQSHQTEMMEPKCVIKHCSSFWDTQLILTFYHDLRLEFSSQFEGNYTTTVYICNIRQQSGERPPQMWGVSPNQSFLLQITLSPDTSFIFSSILVWYLILGA